MESVRWSVLDRSLVRQGEHPSAALPSTIEFARAVERLGYHRFWVSEHHGVPGVAGSAPTVLAAAIAASTSRVRIGTGGVMLPNHRPLVVAEQFGVLESLYPGRIDMGLGRSLGFTGGIRTALGAHREDAEAFDGQLEELLGYFSGDRATVSGVHAVPAEGRQPPTFLLATGAAGAQRAAVFGLPLVIAAVRGEREMRAAVERYRAEFRPGSERGASPYVMVSVPVAVAETTDRARDRAVSEAWSMAYSRVHGEFPGLAPAQEILSRSLSTREQDLLAESMEGRIYGTVDDVGPRLTQLVAEMGADEVLVTASTFAAADQLDSISRLAGWAGLPAQPGTAVS
ncbi:luciferase family oxidoreductase group 1 [Tamaricihabitans halophyticus]|uniref:Luciferase family oxidoreductase group 1 n=1 Tax=Tamaricihabitans halophyticus TaxID=1262583 RepID=A0A4R2QUA7_9PSEU|nr:LLM class flavin-dependent oxidoreductase [Tamaricihabitans halophyticus]TCP53553.1 luciferase family oxidoreductase group 1 [Tamaricihabitans halophyticus]